MSFEKQARKKLSNELCYNVHEGARAITVVVGNERARHTFPTLLFYFNGRFSYIKKKYKNEVFN